MVLVQIVLHLPFFHLSPMGTHTWRQVMGQATAKNYFEEDNRFFYPRQDVRKERDDLGISYFEFPLIYYVTAQSYRITGFHHANARVVMFLMGILLIVSAFKLARATGLTETSAKWFVFFLSFSPYFFYYSITIIPDLPALAWFSLGLAMIIPEIKKERWRTSFWAGVILLTVGTLSKASLLFFGIPVAYFFFAQFLKTGHKTTLVAAFSAALVLLSANGAQYLHARALFEQAPVERQAYTELAPHPFPTDVNKVLKTLKPALTTWFLEFFVNSAAIPLFLTGFFAGLIRTRWKGRGGAFWSLWALSFVLFSLFFFEQLREHSYYQTPMLFIAALVSTYGVQILLKRKITRWIAVLCVSIIPFSMAGRVFHRWTTHREVPVELLEQSHRFEAIIPKSDRVLVVGDTGPVTTLYYLNRKGVVIPGEASEEKIAELKLLGFNWIVSKGPLKNRSRGSEAAHSAYQVGKFTISQM
ncbi:MAG: ArnT family glycosyltransferase [Nitrospinota bacterium]